MWLELTVALTVESTPCLAGNDCFTPRLLRFGRGGALASIEDAPLQLNGLILEHPFAQRSELVSRILHHYLDAGIREWHKVEFVHGGRLICMKKVLGSADIVGNPISLVSNLGEGFYDFFHEPASGLVISPKMFMKGIGKVLYSAMLPFLVTQKQGSKSLMKKSVFGLFNTTSKITGTIAKGIQRSCLKL